MKLYFFLISINAAIAAIALFIGTAFVYNNGNTEDAIALFIAFVGSAYAAKIFRDAYLEADNNAKAAD